MMIGGGGGGQSQKNIFEPLGPPFGLKIRAGGGWGQAPGPLPRILHCCPNDMHFCLGN